MPKFFKTKVFSIFLFILTVLVCSYVSAEGGWITIKGKVDPLLTKVDFANSPKTDPAIFENDHHAINKCYQIRNAYLTFIESGEGLFEGYELNKHKSNEISGQALTPINEQVANQDGIYLGMTKQQIEGILKQTFSSTVTRISYESVEVIKGTPFDVVTS